MGLVLSFSMMPQLRKSNLSSIGHQACLNGVINSNIGTYIKS